MTAIQEARNLTTYTLNELLGSLITHELEVKRDEHDNTTKEGIALKSSTHHEDDVSSDKDCDEDIALITKKFNRYLRKQRFV